MTGQPTDPRSMNRFAYAEANPWTFSDPSGHATCFSSSDLCDETMAIRHQGTAAARDAARRSSSRDKVNHWYNRALHARAPARIYETNPKATPETASADAGWGEAASIAAASTAGATAGKTLRGFAYGDGEDGIAGVVKGVIGGVGDFAVGAVTTPIYAVTHLSDAATGLQCFVLDGCLQGAAHDLGWDKPVENLGKGWDTFVHMSDEEKASFATTVMLTGLTLRGGVKGIRGEPVTVASSTDLGEAGLGPHAGASIPARGPLRDFTAAEREAIDAIGYDTGCHTCGMQVPATKSGHFVPDHQPPTALVPPGTPQQLLPQCLACSRDQGLLIARLLRERGW